VHCVNEGRRLVYVNYGRIEDYARLASEQSGVDVSGAIAIARYGRIFRGDKARLVACSVTYASFRPIAIRWLRRRSLSAFTRNRDNRKKRTSYNKNAFCYKSKQFGIIKLIVYHSDHSCSCSIIMVI